MRIIRTMLSAFFLISASGFCFGQDIGCPQYALFEDSEDARIPLPTSEAFQRWRSTHSSTDAISTRVDSKGNTPSTRTATKKARYPKSKFWDEFGEYTVAGTVAAIGGYLIWGRNITWSEGVYRKAIGGYLMFIAIAHMLCPSCD
jgi:hypothetical protein